MPTFRLTPVDQVYPPCHITVKDLSAKTVLVVRRGNGRPHLTLTGKLKPEARRRYGDVVQIQQCYLDIPMGVTVSRTRQAELHFRAIDGQLQATVTHYGTNPTVITRFGQTPDNVFLTTQGERGVLLPGWMITFGDVGYRFTVED